MDYSGIGLFKMVGKKMSWLSQRQDVLAQNVSNANTPKYRPHDLVPLDFRSTLGNEFKRLELAAPDRGPGLQGSLPTQPTFRNPESRQTFEEAPDGNAVVLEEQLAKVQDTNLQFAAATNIYKKYSGMLMTTLGRRG